MSRYGRTMPARLIALAAAVATIAASLTGWGGNGERLAGIAAACAIIALITLAAIPEWCGVAAGLGVGAAFAAGCDLAMDATGPAPWLTMWAGLMLAAAALDARTEHAPKETA